MEFWFPARREQEIPSAGGSGPLGSAGAPGPAPGDRRDPAPPRPGSSIGQPEPSGQVPSYWDEIAPEQRRAAIELVPELQGLRGAGVPAAGTAVKAAGLSAPMDLLAKAPAQRRSNFFSRQFAKEVAADLTAKIGRPLGVPVEAKVGLRENAEAWAEAGVWSGGRPGTSPGPG